MALLARPAAARRAARRAGAVGRHLERRRVRRTRAVHRAERARREALGRLRRVVHWANALVKLSLEPAWRIGIDRHLVDRARRCRCCHAEAAVDVRAAARSVGWRGIVLHASA